MVIEHLCDGCCGKCFMYSLTVNCQVERATLPTHPSIYVPGAVTELIYPRIQNYCPTELGFRPNLLPISLFDLLVSFA